MLGSWAESHRGSVSRHPDLLVFTALLKVHSSNKKEVSKQPVCMLEGDTLFLGSKIALPLLFFFFFDSQSLVSFPPSLPKFLLNQCSLKTEQIQ